MPWERPLPDKLRWEEILTANGTIVLPAMFILSAIDIQEYAGNSIVGGIRIGTTAGAADVVAISAISGNHFGGLTLLKTHFAAETTLHVEAVTLWNSAACRVSVLGRRVFANV